MPRCRFHEAKAVPKVRLRPVDDIERFLQIVCREVEAIDAKLELGGRPPTSPLLVAHQIREGFRLVAVFERQPLEPGDVRDKLAELAGSFADTVDASIPVATRRIDVVQSDSSASAMLDEALAVLARQADAIAAVVIDEGSPIVWGSSEPPPRIEDVETARRIITTIDEGEALQPADVDALRGAELDPRRMAVLRAITATRGVATPRLTESDASFGVLARPFGGIYRLILAFEGSFPTLKAEGALRRALPAIERLVADLPPLDPEPRGQHGRLLTLRPRA